MRGASRSTKGHFEWQSSLKVYGSAVDRLPTSFIQVGNLLASRGDVLCLGAWQVFEEAIARALFCSNPPLSEDPPGSQNRHHQHVRQWGTLFLCLAIKSTVSFRSTYVDTDGNPLCIQKGIYETPTSYL